MWFRVEVEKDWAIKSCVEVEGSFTDTATVFYVEAESKHSAIIRIKQYLKSCATEAASKTRRANAYRAAKRCVRCGCPVETGKSECLDCRGKMNARRRKRLAQAKAGVMLPSKSLEEKAAHFFTRRNENTKKSRRRVLLKQCLTAFDMNPIGFRAWLLAEIAKLDVFTESQAAE